MKPHSALALVTLVLTAAGPPPNTTGSYQRILGFDGGPIIPVQLDLNSLNPDGGPLQVQVVGSVGATGPDGGAVQTIPLPSSTAETLPSPSPISLVGGTSTTVCSANSSRLVSCQVCNQAPSTVPVYVTLGTGATNTAYVLSLDPPTSGNTRGDCWSPAGPWTGAVSVYAIVDGGVVGVGAGQ